MSVFNNRDFIFNAETYGIKETKKRVYKQNGLDFILKQKVIDEWTNYFNGWEWDLFFNFTFNKQPGSLTDAYDVFIKRYFDFIKKKYKCKFGCKTILLRKKNNTNNTIHAHSLLKSVSIYPVTFKNASKEQLDELHSYWKHDRIRNEKKTWFYNDKIKFSKHKPIKTKNFVKNVDKNEGICGYMAKNIMIDNVDDYDFFDFRTNVLEYLKD